MLIVALFIANTWKQPRCPLVNKWINKLWYIHAMEYYSAIKANELLSHEKTWRNLEYISLSERSLPEKSTWCQLYEILAEAGL